MELYGEQNVSVAALVLHRQMSLGHLIRLEVHVDENTLRSGGTTDLLHLITNAVVLRELKVDFQDNTEPLPLFQSPNTSSPALKRLVYWDNALDLYVEHMLRTHASTLEEVDLKGFKLHVGMLAVLPNIRILLCPLLNEMQELLKCSSLTWLELYTVWRDRRLSGLPEQCAGLLTRGDPVDKRAADWTPTSECR